MTILANVVHPEILPLLNKAYKIYPDDKPLEHWFKLVDDGQALLITQFFEDKLTSVWFVELRNKGILCRIGGGIDNEWDINEMYHFLVKMCKDFNKPYLRLQGRAGWKRHLKPLGFEVVQNEQSTAPNGRIIQVFSKTIKL